MGFEDVPYFCLLFFIVNIPEVLFVLCFDCIYIVYPDLVFDGFIALFNLTCFQVTDLPCCLCEAAAGVVGKLPGLIGVDLEDPEFSNEGMDRGGGHGGGEGVIEEGFPAAIKV